MPLVSAMSTKLSVPVSFSMFLKKLLRMLLPALARGYIDIEIAVSIRVTNRHAIGIWYRDRSGIRQLHRLL